MNQIRKAGALIISEKRLLIVKPRGKPFYINPGGKYEDGETAERCLERELNEELSIKLQECRHYKDYDVATAAHSNLPLRLELWLVLSYSGTPVPASEIESFAWMSKEDYVSKKYNLAPSFYQYIPDLIKEGLL